MIEAILWGIAIALFLFILSGGAAAWSGKEEAYRNPLDPDDGDFYD